MKFKIKSIEKVVQAVYRHKIEIQLEGYKLDSEIVLEEQLEFDKEYELSIKNVSYIR